jgi:site-specific recombinase XerD
MNRIEPVFGSKNVYNLKADDVEQFKKALIKKGYKPASINYYLAQLRAIINYAIAKDVIEIINPCTKVKLLTLDNARERILSEEEIELLLSTISHNKKLIFCKMHI